MIQRSNTINNSDSYYRDSKTRRYYEKYSTDVYVQFGLDINGIVKLIKQLYDGMKGCDKGRRSMVK